MPMQGKLLLPSPKQIRILRHLTLNATANHVSNIQVQCAQVLLTHVPCRSYAPPAAHLVKDLYFDYTDASAVASATFLNAVAVKVNSQPAGSTSLLKSLLLGGQRTHPTIPLSIRLRITSKDNQTAKCTGNHKRLLNFC